MFYNKWHPEKKPIISTLTTYRSEKKVSGCGWLHFASCQQTQHIGSEENQWVTEPTCMTCDNAVSRKGFGTIQESGFADMLTISKYTIVYNSLYFNFIERGGAGKDDLKNMYLAFCQQTVCKSAHDRLVIARTGKLDKKTLSHICLHSSHIFFYHIKSSTKSANRGGEQKTPQKKGMERSRSRISMIHHAKECFIINRGKLIKSGVSE